VFGFEITIIGKDLDKICQISTMLRTVLDFLAPNSV